MIASIVDGPISGEVKATTEDAAGMIAEGREIAAIHPEHGGEDSHDGGGPESDQGAFRRGHQVQCDADLQREPGVSGQARAGGRTSARSWAVWTTSACRAIDLVRTIADMFAPYDDIHTEIIAASVRNPVHVTDCALAGRGHRHGSRTASSSR